MKAKLEKKALNIAKNQKLRIRQFTRLIRNDLESVNKIEGKYKMAEHFHASLRQLQIFEEWLVLTFLKK